MSRLGSATSEGRPQSARSRSAWDDGSGGYDNQGGPDDLMVGAMQDEMYDPNVTVDTTSVVAHNQPPPVVHVQDPPQGCWYKFKKGVRCE